MHYHEIESIQAFTELLQSTQAIIRIAFQNIDFELVANLPKGAQFTSCIFLGCNLPHNFEKELDRSNLVFPKMDIPFNPYAHALYSKETLMGEYELGNARSYEKTLDKRVYDHYMQKGKEAEDIKETLARRLHDHAITDALYDFLGHYPETKIVAIMGGHDLSRNDSNYFEVARISQRLTEKGYLMISGGGPGAMEATHLGAWFANQDPSLLHEAIAILSQAPTYKHPLWLDKAFEVMHRFKSSEYKSLGIPTWFYGHEPPTPFATHIAKYFENSIREDGLLAIAKGGVIFSPGSAGTIQEIFQDAAQNHYQSFGISSPMVFFNSHYWTHEIPVYPLLQSLSIQGKYRNMLLSCCDTQEEVLTEITQFTQNS